MIVSCAVSAGVLFAVALYLILSRNTQRVAMGFLMLSNGANLLVISGAGLPRGAMPPIVGSQQGAPFVDPLPHALLLTAIVIGLGAAAFLLALSARTHHETGSDELPARGDGA